MSSEGALIQAATASSGRLSSREKGVAEIVGAVEIDLVNQFVHISDPSVVRACRSARRAGREDFGEIEIDIGLELIIQLSAAHVFDCLFVGVGIAERASGMADDIVGWESKVRADG